jgi:hypothetical protein
MRYGIPFAVQVTAIRNPVCFGLPSKRVSPRTQYVGALVPTSTSRKVDRLFVELSREKGRR